MKLLIVALDLEADLPIERMRAAIPGARLAFAEMIPIPPADDHGPIIEAAADVVERLKAEMERRRPVD